MAMQRVLDFDNVQNWSIPALQGKLLMGFQPTVLRGFAGAWPAVAQQKNPTFDLAAYLITFASNHRVTTYSAPVETRGRFFYRDELDGFNFERIDEPVSQAIKRIVALREVDPAPAVYAGAIDIALALPGFECEHRCALAGHTATARLWLGNATVVSTHYDLADNLMCVVAGKRRVTLFPPEQLKNLYVGPIDFTLSGQPVSMVDLRYPDLERYPHFAQALQQAQVVELEPGDVLYIPKLWWHHVESLAPLNVMINFWWDHSALSNDNGFTTMMHALTTIAHLPEPERRAWRAFFDHYVFRLEGDPAAHIEPARRGVLGEMTPALHQRILTYVRTMLNRK